jgi:Rod binding domain-containing protein
MSALPPIDDRVLPADVRAGTQADKTRYKTALSFERELVSQLTQQLADTAQTDDDAAGGDDATTGTSASTDSYRQLLPGVLADSIMQAGGLGLARDIARNLKETGR